MLKRSGVVLYGYIMTNLGDGGLDIIDDLECVARGRRSLTDILSQFDNILYPGVKKIQITLQLIGKEEE